MIAGTWRIGSDTRLAGLRVLLVEDEMLVSMLIEDVLADHQCVIVGPFDRIPTALAAAQTEPLDLAVLDVNVAGVKVYPVAEELARRRIPFLLLSGYGANAIPPDRPDWHVCLKPFRSSDLVAMLTQELERARRSG